MTHPGIPAGQNGGSGRRLAPSCDQGADISTLGWILVVAVAWLVIATIVGVLVGRMIRERDRQVPPAPDAAPEVETKENPTRHRTEKGRQRRS